MAPPHVQHTEALHLEALGSILEASIQESTVLESVRCPSCLTHYGLRPERVHPGLRKARCFRCKDVFKIEEAVARLLASTASQEEPGPSPAIEATTPEFAAQPPSVPHFEDPGAVLTLGDLEAPEEEILEKTLMVEPPPEPEPEEDVHGSGGFASAKDAIAKLLGNMPEPSSPPERRSLGRPSQPMDVEATLDALENTLGGVTPSRLSTPPSPSTPSSVTAKLSAEEIQAAMAAADVLPTPPPKPAAPAPSLLEPAAPAPETTLLKIEVGNIVYPNVTLEQATTWIEQGRLQEWHMVARQHSDNWIEANKVPGLRAVFDRIRRQQESSAETPNPSDTGTAKKGIFGWIKQR